MRPFILLAPAMLSALELPAPTLELHPDGARVAWILALPAGGHHLDLPAWCGTGLAVQGAAAWSRQEEAAAPPPLPAALATLLAERNCLVVQAATVAAAGSALSALERRWSDAIAARAAAGETGTAAWQAGLEALLGERNRLDAERQRLDADRHALAERARAAAGRAGPGLLDIEGQEPLTTGALSQAWARAAGAGARRAFLAVQLAAPGTLRIEERRGDCRWRAECDLRIADAGAVLVRRAVIEKPAAFAPGRIAVVALAAPQAPALTAPVPPAVALAAVPVADALRRLVAGGRRQATWDEVPPVGGGAPAGAAAPSTPASEREPASRASDSGNGGVMAIGAGGPRRLSAAAPAGGAAVSPGTASFDLGPIDLAAGAERIAVPIGGATLAVTADEWALFPEDRPAALRRVTVRLDGRPLLPGRIRVLSEGQVPVEGQVPWIPGGGSLTVCAGIDERIVVAKTSAWEVWPGDNDRQRRREGSDTWLVNAGDTAARVAVYRTMPVSTVDEVAVDTDPDTTPGATVVIPGLLRWQVELAPGVPTRIGLGWVLTAKGSFSFAP